jgi:hypothetical protein
MKKRDPRRLTLAKETLRNLEDAEVQPAAGGLPTDGLYSCAPTCLRSCRTCDC